MSDYITVRGTVGTEVQQRRTHGGDAVAEFRLACSGDWLNRETGEWVKGQTNWYTVQAFRGLAENLWRSLAKGDPVVVSGKLKLRQWSTEDGRRGTAPEIDADTVGHDLRRGSASFTKIAVPAAGSREAAETGQGGADYRAMALASAGAGGSTDGEFGLEPGLGGSGGNADEDGQEETQLPRAS